MAEIVAYVCALIIGITLGLIGGGGSILTVPVLFYLMQFSSVMATAYSLFIVGSSASVGALRYARSGLIDLRIALLFGVPSILSVFLTRKFIVPAIPEQVLTFGSYTLTRDMTLMVLFAVMMVFASVSMIRPRRQPTTRGATGQGSLAIPAIEGIVVGALTGLVGAGGGFLIIPALILFSNMPMKKAIGTSLLIISAKSLIGFVGDAMNYDMDWSFLISFSVLAVIGIVIGSFLAKRIDGEKLKSAFGWFVLLMGIWILISEFVGM